MHARGRDPERQPHLQHHRVRARRDQPADHCLDRGVAVRVPDHRDQRPARGPGERRRGHRVRPGGRQAGRDALDARVGHPGTQPPGDVAHGDVLLRVQFQHHRAGQRPGHGGGPDRAAGGHQPDVRAVVGELPDVQVGAAGLGPRTGLGQPGPQPGHVLPGLL